MILLDTNALLWFWTNHRRAAPLGVHVASLMTSPICLLELQFLVEVGRIAAPRGVTAAILSADPRIAVDDVGSLALAEHALPLSWTRDPFDRLIVAHARARRWRLATGDRLLLSHLAPREVVAL